MRVHPWMQFGAVACLLAAATVALRTQERQPATEWRYFGGDKGFTRYSPLDQINKDNAKTLKIAWRRPAVNDAVMKATPSARINGYLKATPIFVDGVLYTQDASGYVMAVDGETGTTLWVEDASAAAQTAPAAGDAPGGGRLTQSTRGVAYWRGGASNVDKRIIAIRGEDLVAVNAETGTPAAGFGLGGRVSLHFDENQPLAGRFGDSTGPMVVGNVIVITGNTAGAGDGGNKKESAPEDVRGYDVTTGKHLWTFHVVPREGEFGVESWGNGSWKTAGDLGAWNQMSADEELGYVYIPLTAPTSALYGGWRPGDNLYANSLIALDAKTGKRVWHFQMVHHDLWEYDNVGPAMLGDITVAGRRIKAIMQPNKNGFLYVLDRTNGTPVWPIEERPVPQSTVPGEHSSPTQPIPTKPPAFDRQGISDDDLIDYTPELKTRAREIASHFVVGPLYTPPSVPSPEANGKKGTLVQPGEWGSANWNTGAFDPETGMYYAVSMSLPGPEIEGVVKQSDPGATMEYSSRGAGAVAAEISAAHAALAGEVPPPDPVPAGGPAGRPQPQGLGGLNISGLPIIKGPYGRITALDLRTGTLAWMAANGDGPRHHPLLKGLNLPPLGTPNRPAPMVTKTLLFLGEGSNAIMGTPRVDWGWGKKFRAYDKATGKVVAEIELPSGTTAGPMTYMAGGKQYIVVAIGANDYAPEYVALTLP